MTALPATSDDGAFWDIWLTPYYLPCITVADEVGTFAAISGEALSTAALADRIGVDARALGVHLALLGGLGMVERRGGLWRATALARTWMHPDGEGYFGPLIRRQTPDPIHVGMMETLRTGDKGNQHVTFVEEWERGELSLDVARHIARFMHAHSVANSKAVARLGDIAGTARLLDVGGGSGVYAIEAARQNPGLTATILEIDAMCIAAQDYIDRAGIGDRVKSVAVDMFRQDWPTGYDAHFFSNIFHDWSEPTACSPARALPRCHRAGGSCCTKS